jgi:hypothetical protein
MQIENHILTIEDYTQDLPRLATAATVTVWQVPAEYQASGYFVAIDVIGEPATLPACDSKDAVLIGMLELQADESAQLDQAKIERLEIINAECDKSLTPVTASYPESEVKSWPQQVKEAEALATNPQAVTPLLDGIATYRGITTPELAAKVILKANAYAMASGAFFGKRQLLEKALNEAVTLEEVSAVVW